jgi:hypothetical protein
VAGKTTAGPGSYAVAVTVSDESGGTAFTSFVITVTEEDAEPTYTGDVLAFTSPGATAATVLLRATVRDGSLDPANADAEPGSIANATVTFQDDGAALCGPLPMSLLEGTTSGTASCSVPLWPGTHSIDVVVGGFYTGTSTSVIEVDDPEGSVVTGAGLILASRSAGVYAADAGSRVAFAVSVKYKVPDRDKHDQRAPRAPKGHVEVLFRSHGNSYVLRSSDVDLLGVSEATPQGKECHGRAPKCIGKAETRWTASLIDVTRPRRPVTVRSNVALQVTATDAGDRHGSGDTIGLTLWDGNSLLFSSAWTGAQTVEQAVKTGKITVD